LDSLRAWGKCVSVADALSLDLKREVVFIQPNNQKQTDKTHDIEELLAYDFRHIIQIRN
jgi:hypothetical protein